MIPILLTYRDPGGQRTMIQLPQDESVTSSYLPNEVTRTLRLSSTDSVTHSSVRLDVHPSHILISAWDDSSGRTSIINSNGDEMVIPVSSSSQQVYMMLRDGDQFVSPAGRWLLEFDDSQTSISNSMRPPTIASTHGKNGNGALSDNEIRAETSETKDDLNRPEEIVGAKGEERDQLNVMSSHRASHSLPSRDNSLVNAAPSADGELHHIQDPSRHNEDAMGEFPTQAKEQNVHDYPQNPSSAYPTASIKSSNSTTSVPEQVSATVSLVDATVNEPKHEKSVAEITQDDSEENSSSTPSPKTYPRCHKRKVSDMKDLEPNFKNKRPKITLASIQADKTGSDTELSSNDSCVQEVITGFCEKVSATDTSSGKTKNKSKSSNEMKKAHVELAEGTQLNSAVSTLSDGPLAVVFSSNSTIQTKKKTMAVFTKLGGRVVKSLEKADILCVAGGPLKKTSKLIIAIVKGKIIVTEAFIVECQKRGRFPDPVEFMPQDENREKVWGFNLTDAINRGRNPDSGLPTLLSGHTVYITPQLRKELGSIINELKDIALAMGVKDFRQRLPDKSNANDNSVLVLGSSNDSYVNQINKLGLPLYVKDLLTMSALRGRLETDTSEFKVDPVIKQEDTSSQ